MSECTNWLPLEAVAAGMVLAESLFNSSGEVLLPAGATLSESSLGALRRRGIELLPVVGDSSENPVADKDKQAQIDDLRRSIEHRFRRCGSEGASGIVQRCVLRYKAGQLR